MLRKVDEEIDIDMRILELSEDERPREKMRDRGVAALSNVELLAVILRTGTGGRNAMELARELYAVSGNSLCELSSLSADRMCAVPGIGFGKAASIVSAFELGRRCALEKAGNTDISVTDSKVAARLFAPYLRILDHEECWALFLNQRNRPLGKEMIGSGGLNATPIDSRVVTRLALEKKATGVILFHNHPSGSPEPGASDIKHTSSIRKGLASLNIALLDHIIIAGDSFFSFSEERVFHL